jgi:hypothetical protein
MFKCFTSYLKELCKGFEPLFCHLFAIEKSLANMKSRVAATGIEQDTDVHPDTSSPT